MLQVTRKLALLLLIVFGLFLFVQPALAQEGGRWGTDLWKGEGVFVQGGAENIIVNIVMWMMSIIALLALAFIVYGAIKYVTSAGNEKQVEEAKKILLYAIIGLVIAILAVVVIQLVARVVERGEKEANSCKLIGPDGTVACIAGSACRGPNVTLPCDSYGYTCLDMYCPEGTGLNKIDEDCVCQ